jgi:coenzyme F420-reducing hydrogenase alpha subunit
VVCLGPAARFALNQAHLTPLAREAVSRHGLADPWRHPHRSIAVRCVETLFALEEAARIIDARPTPEQPFVEVRPRAATGHGCTEAPRGSCYHRYCIDDDGIIQDARIVPPTAVNHAAIEHDLLRFVAPRTHLSDDELRRGCEQVIRNFDPCISCAAHFLRLEIRRQ